MWATRPIGTILRVFRLVSGHQGDKGGEEGGDKGGEKEGDTGGEKEGDTGGEKEGDTGGEKEGDTGGEKEGAGSKDAPRQPPTTQEG